VIGRDIRSDPSLNDVARPIDLKTCPGAGFDDLPAVAAAVRTVLAALQLVVPLGDNARVREMLSTPGQLSCGALERRPGPP
jgi:hypothetical protein